MTNRQYFSEMVMNSVQMMAERMPSAVCGVKWPPVAWTTVCKVYSGLVPRSPNTTPSAAKLAKRVGFELSMDLHSEGIQALPYPRFRHSAARRHIKARASYSFDGPATKRLLHQSWDEFSTHIRD
jgi:hypothetical protein